MAIVFRVGVVPEEELEFVITAYEMFLQAPEKAYVSHHPETFAPTRFFVSLCPSDRRTVLAWIARDSNMYGWQELADLAGASAQEIEAYMRNAARLGLDTGYLYETDDE